MMFDPLYLLIAAAVVIVFLMVAIRR